MSVEKQIPTGLSAPLPTRSSPSRKTIRKLLSNPLGLASIIWLTLLAIAAVLAPVLTSFDPLLTDLDKVVVSPSWTHPLGTDSVGRDVLSRLLFGGRVTLLSAVLASVTAIVIGVPAGLLAGYHGARLDGVASWVTNLLMSVPSIVVLLALRAALGPSVWISMIAFGVLLAPSFFRLARAATQGVRRELYIDAAKVSGLSDTRIIARHIFSVVRAPIIIQGAMVGGMAISIQSGLDFLGLGDPSSPTWGIMLSEAFAKIYQFPTLLIAPGLAISLTIAALALFANALRDSLEDSPTAAHRKRGKRTAHAEHRRLLGADGPALEVRSLRVGYRQPDGGHKEVVHGVDLTIPKVGEVLGLVGESGSGKTQIALSILGLLPEGGDVLGGTVGIRSTGQTGDANKAAVGYIPQEPMTNLDPSFTIGHQLIRPLIARHGMTRREAIERSEDLLRQVGISDPDRTMRSYPHQISGGMAQRVLIAGAVAAKPSLLVADEPTTALDVTVQADVLDVLRDLQQKNDMAMLLVTHNFGVVADLCDRVAVMCEGVIVEEGDVRKVLRDPQHPYTKKLLGASLIGRERQSVKKEAYSG